MNSLADPKSQSFATAGLSPCECATPFATTMADLLDAMGAEQGDRSAALQVPIAVRRLRAGESLVHQGATAEALYFVRAGTFKAFHTDVDGYEQVLAFATRGEVLGFDALCMESHPTAIAALESSSVFVVLRSDLMALGMTVPAFTMALQRAGSLSLARSRELADLMAAVASEVRLARFLIHVSQRMAAARMSPRRFHLSMGRREIASLLGVANETVSRSFSALSLAGLLHVADRDVEILDMEGLKAYARSTRRRADESLVAPTGGMFTRRSTPGRRSTAGLRTMVS
jgi:CRP/FNR family transcriptional regulator